MCTVLAHSLAVATRHLPPWARRTDQQWRYYHKVPAQASSSAPWSRKELETNVHDRRRRALALRPYLRLFIRHDRKGSHAGMEFARRSFLAIPDAGARETPLACCLQSNPMRTEAERSQILYSGSSIARRRWTSVCSSLDNFEGCISFSTQGQGHRTSKPNSPSLPSPRHEEDLASPLKQSRETDAKENRAPHVDTKPESWC